MSGFGSSRLRMQCRSAVMLLLASCLLTGCWNKYELTELGFVMGVAIDSGKDGKVQLTTQFYMPQQSGVSSSERTFDSNINVVTTSSTNLQAARSIAGELGRKAQWSHMRIILIGEELAKKANLGELLDLFYRDPEPRLTASILITKGSARSYLQKKPTIEQTTSQQIKRSEETAARNAGMTVESNLLELGKQMKSASGNARIAYIVPHSKDEESYLVSGIALIHEGKMVGKISGSESRGLLLMTNEFTRGTIDIPCEDRSGLRQTSIESFEVSDYRSRIKPRIVNDRLEIMINSEVKGSASELKCSTITNTGEEARFVARTEEAIRQEMERTFALLQQYKLDMLQIGNRIYRSNPKLWYRVKPEWSDYIAGAKLTVRVRVQMNTTGTMIGKPVFE